MAGLQATERAEELRREQDSLVKAETDIEQGLARLRSQQDLVADLQVAGRDTSHAERLMQLMTQTLVEWERHRLLIAQRVAYLKKQASGA